MELVAGAVLLLLILFGEIRLYRKHGLDGLSYRCAFSDQEATEGDTLEFFETVENAKILPVPWLKAELTVPKWLEFPETHCAVTGEFRFVTGFFSVKGFARIRRIWKVSCQKRGIYQVEHVVLVTTDLLGTVHLSLPASDTGNTIKIFPKRFTKAGLLLPKLMRQPFGTDSVCFSLSTDPCLPVGIRDYAFGDPIHQIHWKDSAHAGRLLVRQEEPTAQQTITVILALQTQSSDSGKMTQDKLLLEHSIRVCAQCLWELCKGGWTIRLIAGENDSQNMILKTPYNSGSSGYHYMMEFLAALTLDCPTVISHLLQNCCYRDRQELCLLVTPYTDEQIRQWKNSFNGYVLVTGHAHDGGNCADCVVADI